MLGGELKSLWRRAQSVVLIGVASVWLAAAVYAQANVAPSPVSPVLPAPASLDSSLQGNQVDIPQRPADPKTAKVYAVLEARCARCHQSGKTGLPLASGGLANILSLSSDAANPRLVRPGLPDASRLYDVFSTRHAPLDVYESDAVHQEPQPEEIEIIRSWIKDIPATAQSCKDRIPIKAEDHETLIRDAQRIAGADAKDMRFISLAHIYNACATPVEMTAYRQALTKLLNSLSWAGEAAEINNLGADETLLAFRLADVGWVGGHWDIIQRAYPAALKRDIAADIKTAAGTGLPIINGDWLAAEVSDAPLYYTLLGLPSKLSELAKMNGVDLDQNIRAGTARRMAIRSSVVTRGNRIIERHTGGRGALWISYDFATSSGEQNVFDRPLGPRISATTKYPFKPDQIRAMFPLPNGFFAYAIFDAAGNRIDRVLPGLEKQYSGVGAAALEPGTKAGANCFSCHVGGLKPAKDEFRAFAAAENSPVPNDIRDLAFQIYPSESEMTLLYTADAEKSEVAVKDAGIEPAATLDGEEIVSALARRYRGALDLKAAAAEIGEAPDQFLTSILDKKGAVQPLARRLQQGVLPRDDLDQLFALIKGIDAPVEGSGYGGFLRDAKAEIGLSLWVEKPRPVGGDLVVVKASADNQCYMTIVSIDAGGTATVLFPNDFESDNLVAAGQTISIPAPQSPYQLRFKADGTETLVARCSTSPAPPTGIEHDFDRQRFTLLGNWEAFIQDTLVTDAELRQSPEKAERARIARAAALNRRQQRGARSAQRPDSPFGRNLRDGRAVVIIGAG